MSPKYSFSAEITASNIYEQNLNSVVLVAGISKKKKNNTSGSGFIIQESGLIATNWHVISKAKKIIVRTNINDQVFEAKLLGFDQKQDIAIIQIKKNKLTPVKISNSSLVKIGDRVFTIGNPLGLENTISDGLISSIRDFEKDFHIFQISVPLSAGSSGGALFNSNGEVVGITTATLASGQALNFAIPSNYLLKLLKKISHRNGHKSKSNRFSKLNEDKSVIHIVSSKESLYFISQLYNVDIDQIKEANDIKNFKIYVGQKLKIPNQTKNQK